MWVTATATQSSIPFIRVEIRWHTKLFIHVAHRSGRSVFSREEMTTPWHVLWRKGFRLWLWAWQFSRTSCTNLSFPLVELHLRFPVIQKCQPCLYSKSISPDFNSSVPETPLPFLSELLSRLSPLPWLWPDVAPARLHVLRIP